MRSIIQQYYDMLIEALIITSQQNICETFTNSQMIIITTITSIIKTMLC